MRTPSSRPADFKLRHYQGPEHGQYQHCLVGLAPAVGARVIRLQVYHHDLEWLPLAKLRRSRRACQCLRCTRKLT
jgi:hypothetical protein